MAPWHPMAPNFQKKLEQCNVFNNLLDRMQQIYLINTLKLLEKNTKIAHKRQKVYLNGHTDDVHWNETIPLLFYKLNIEMMQNTKQLY